VFISGILPAFDYLENRLTENTCSMFKCGPSYLICKLVQLFEASYVAERSVTMDLVRGLSKSSRWGEAGPHGANAARPAHLEKTERAISAHEQCTCLLFANGEYKLD
jgi:hypothetical protein